MNRTHLRKIFLIAGAITGFGFLFYLCLGDGVAFETQGLCAFFASTTNDQQYNKMEYKLWKINRKESLVFRSLFRDVWRIEEGVWTETGLLWIDRKSVV